MSGYGWFKMHDAWWTDDAVTELAAREPGAVCLFLAAIGWCHMHDTDGTIPSEALEMVARTLAFADEKACTDALVTSRLVLKSRGNTPRKQYTLRSYAKWQTTSDQRKDNAERMRSDRARATKRREEREEKSARAPARAAIERPGSASRPPSDGAVTDPRRVFDDLDPDELKRRASLRIIELEGGGTG